jgi:hypothetical protein
MSLTALNWRKLPTRTITPLPSSGSIILNHIYDMLTGSLYFDGSSRVTGSNSAWGNVGRFITGSNTEAVYCYPPTTTAMSQSFVIASISNSGAATSVGKVSNATDSSINAMEIFAACFKNSGTFSYWTGSGGFGSGSNCSGYATIVSAGTSLLGSVSKITIYESQEAIGIFFTKSTNDITWGCLSGAIIDPEATVTSVDAEADNRIYGITTGYNDSNGLGANFLSGTGILNHGTLGNYGKFVTFNPQLSSTQRTGVQSGGKTDTGYTTISGKLVKVPIMCQVNNNTSPYYYLGRIREISMVKNMPSNQIIRDASNNILGFTVGKGETTTQETILLNY